MQAMLVVVFLQVLQMVGRAGRPQFDNEGVAVIMTSKDSIHRYQRMVAGQVSCGLSPAALKIV